MEAFGGLVGKDMAETAEIALRSDKFPKLSDFCAVYAQSEALDLIRSKVPIEQLIAGYYYAMARRISTLVDRLGMKKDFVIIGGLARNPGIVSLVEGILKAGRLAPGLNGSCIDTGPGRACMPMVSAARNPTHRPAAAGIIE